MARLRARLEQGPHRKLIDRPEHRAGHNHPLRCRFNWKFAGKQLLGQQSITQGPGGNSLFIQQEQLIQRRPGRTERWTRSDNGETLLLGQRGTDRPRDVVHLERLADGESMLKRFAWESFERWQFLRLSPEGMGQPTPQQRAARVVRMAQDGSNVAEYLHELRDIDRAAFDGLLDALRFVLPYAIDLQPSLTSELERAFYLKLWEDHYEIPGWVLSTGTLRTVALLACLRHPKPPPLLIVEEVENGLDPRTLHLVVEEIRAAITAGTTQVILTTHSPYLLDLLDLSHIVVVEREEGQPVFRRPDAEQLAQWAKSFAPGQLYTMGHLTRATP